MERKVTRREAIKGSVAAAVIGASVHSNLALAIPARLGFCGGGGAGFYPLSHSMQPLGIGMQVVYPRPDAETNAYAAHHWAYWNGTTGLLYRRRVGVSFGRFPYVYQLMSGPPGMYIGASIWNPAWNCGGQAAAQAGYGVVYWTPTSGNTSGGPWTVWVRVYDQNYPTNSSSYVDVQWTLNVAGDYNSSTKVGHIFVANSGAVSPGNDANSGGLTSPLASIVGAYGASYATGGELSAFPQAICILRGSSVDYVPPAYTDNPSSAGASYFAWNPTTKPAGLLVYPGETATFDWTGTQTGAPLPSLGAAYASVHPGDDAFFQDFVLNGFSTTQQNPRGITVANNRVTCDNVQWTNSGTGSTSGSNATLFFLDGVDGAPSSYFFATSCLDSGRAGGHSGNNYGFASSYGFNYVLWEFNELYAPSSTMDGAFYFKDGTQFGCQRGNLSNITSSTHIHGTGQSFTDHVTAGIEYCYNTVISSSLTPQRFSFGAAAFTYGNVATYRNSFTNGEILSSQSTYNLMGPTAETPVLTAGSSSFPAGAQYWQYTSLGVTGESVHNDGNGNNEVTATLAAGDVVMLNIILPLDQNGTAISSGTNIYRSTTSGGEEYLATLAAGVSTYTDTGTATTATTPPATNTAISAARTVINSNALQGSSAGFPSGALYTNDANNLVEASGLLNSNGTLNTTNYAASLGLAGADIA